MAIEQAVHAAPQQSVLEANRSRLRADLMATIRAYEQRYEVQSESLQAELSAGRLRETAEVAQWVIAWDALQRLTVASR